MLYNNGIGVMLDNRRAERIGATRAIGPTELAGRAFQAQARAEALAGAGSG